MELVSLVDVGIALEVDETGETLEQNAALKARSYAVQSGLWTLADDSGLEVDALGGWPGVRSKRITGEELSDALLLRTLLRLMDHVPWEERTARFRCVLALADPSGLLCLYEGVCDGFIQQNPLGAGGFGYDPIFFLPDLGRSLGELTSLEKNQVSHRARAIRKVIPALQTFGIN